jgi:RimJ/RimL family protein N-acetyltransferase
MKIDNIQVVPYSKEHAKSISEWLFEGVSEEVVRSQRDELLKPGPEEVFSVCAMKDSTVIGVCTGVRMRWAGSRHRIEMVQVVVHESFRGQGIAQSMMRPIASHFLTRDVEIIQISTKAGNTEAMRAYEKIGFKKFGTLHDGLKYDNEYSDEVMMAAPIAALL